VLARWQARGILDLPLEAIVMIKSTGLGWGGEWASKKDFMHFELSPQQIIDRRSP
jgi:hypothetical protein